MGNEIYVLVAILLIVAYFGLRKIRKINTFLLRFGIIFSILILSVASQDDPILSNDPPTVDVLLPGQPIVVPDLMQPAAQEIANGVDYLSQEAMISSKIRAFLGAEDLNITLLNNSTSLFYA